MKPGKHLLALLGILLFTSNFNCEKETEDKKIEKFEPENFELIHTYDDIDTDSSDYFGGTVIAGYIDNKQKICGFSGIFDDRSAGYFKKIVALEKNGELPIDVIFTDEKKITKKKLLDDYNTRIQRMFEYSEKKLPDIENYHEQWETATKGDTCNTKFFFSGSYLLYNTDTTFTEFQFHGISLIKKIDDEEKAYGFSGEFIYTLPAIEEGNTEKVVFLEKDNGDYQVFIDGKEDKTGQYDGKIEYILECSDVEFENVRRDFERWNEIMNKDL